MRAALLWAWAGAKVECLTATDPTQRQEIRRHRAVLYRLLVEAEATETALQARAPEAAR